MLDELGLSVSEAAKVLDVRCATLKRHRTCPCAVLPVRVAINRQSAGPDIGILDERTASKRFSPLNHTTHVALRDLRMYLSPMLRG